MVVLQDAGGLVFWNEYDIASFQPEFRNRWRAVHRDGRVAHRPTPPPPGPWLPLGNALVLPQLIVDHADPAGYHFPAHNLPEVPEPHNPNRHIYALQGDHKRQCLWKTDGGDRLEKSKSAAQASKSMPELVMLRKGLYINRNRLARVQRRHPLTLITLDNGQTYTITDLGNGLPQRLGLPNLVHLEPRCEALYGNYQLREWPFPLIEAEPEFLRKTFDSARQLIAHLIFQRLRYIQNGDQREWSKSYRGFWYEWLKGCLHRAGFLEEPELQWNPPEEPAAELHRGAGQAEALYDLTFRIFGYFVLDYQLFSFREFGFRAPHPELRRIGTTRPEILLVCEKNEFAEWGIQLHQEFGVSLRLLSGQPSALMSEFMAADLQARVSGPIRILAYVDYDVGGWILARALAKQLERHGLEVDEVVFFLNNDAFSTEEKRLHSHPLPAATAADRTKSKAWFAETHGVDGRPRGLHADYIQPYQRLRHLFLQALNERLRDGR